MAKKLFFIQAICFFLYGNLCAQGLYTKVTKYDKFDDIESSKIEKTLVSINFHNDSTITFETKGHEPINYYISGQPDIYGTRTDEVELSGGLYGCQEDYLAYTEPVGNKAITADFSNCKTKMDSINIQMEWSKHVMAVVTNNLVISHRTISKISNKHHTDGEFPYATDLWWIRFKDGSRIVYTKE